MVGVPVAGTFHRRELAGVVQVATGGTRHGAYCRSAHPDDRGLLKLAGYEVVDDVSNLELVGLHEVGTKANEGGAGGRCTLLVLLEDGGVVGLVAALLLLLFALRSDKRRADDCHKK